MATCFVSDDQGKHWHQVRQQWEGKAVELLGIPALDRRPGKRPGPEIRLRSGNLCRRVAAKYGFLALGKRGSRQNLEAALPSTTFGRNDVKWSGD
jgi:hypothetical protein